MTPKKILLATLILLSLFVISAVVQRIIKDTQMKYGKAKVSYQGPRAPIYPESRLIEEGKPTEGGFFYIAKFESPDTLPTISTWFIDNLPVSGWSIYAPPADPSATDIQLIVGENETREKLNISLIRKVDISLIIFEFAEVEVED